MKIWLVFRSIYSLAYWALQAMTTKMKIEKKIPVICAEPSLRFGAEIFNPNLWNVPSKSIVHSCWSEYSVLHYCSKQISSMCKKPESLCKKHIMTLQEQWKITKYDLDRLIFFALQPDLHIRIQAFFSGVKTLLDLFMQLLTSENVVGIVIDGFHRKGNVYGGKVLNALKKNVRADKRTEASNLETFILRHKNVWIDQVIQARDALVHPDGGMFQLMFNIVLFEKDGVLHCDEIRPPAINSKSIEVFANDTLDQIKEFSTNFFRILKGENA